ncbi:MAG: hypothetical protein KDB00_00960 [Planctomycetales bacterium]|nr:hypothetical protein [Planctomycetales bacterium]
MFDANNLRSILVGVAMSFIGVGLASSDDASSKTSATPPKEVADLLQDNCLACHDQSSREGNLDLESATFDLADAETFHLWQYAFDRKDNYPLPNLYTSMLQRLGLEVDAFASATGTMRGLLR